VSPRSLAFQLDDLFYFPLFSYLASRALLFQLPTFGCENCFGKKITWSHAARATIIGQPLQRFDKLPPIYFESKTFGRVRKRENFSGRREFCAS
jgi:hypothetical protein